MHFCKKPLGLFSFILTDVSVSDERILNKYNFVTLINAKFIVILYGFYAIISQNRSFRLLQTVFDNSVSSKLRVVNRK